MTKRKKLSLMGEVKLSEIIAKPFYSVFWDIQKGKHTYYTLYGGRGSGKSTFISQMIVMGIMEDPNANAAVFRKIGGTIKASVYNQIIWAIEELGVSHLWKCPKSTYECTYIPTGQVIMFRGLDDAQKMKSIKASRGYIKYLWFEELDSFAGEEEIRSVQQSALRGGKKFVVFKSFNPPISKNNWANESIQDRRDDTLCHKSCYLDLPPDWLGEQFLADAEHMKQSNLQIYEHEYLGIPVGTGGNVFENLELREITDDEVRRMDKIFQGLDWGYYPDPFAFIRLHYDRAREKIYFLDEYYVNRQSNQATADWIKSKGYTDFYITCDSAEPKSVADYRAFGLPAKEAIKGPGSVDYGIKWLQKRTIVIDKARTPNAYREFVGYEYERNRKGEIISGYPDENNHLIDATRYACERIFRKFGSTA